MRTPPPSRRWPGCSVSTGSLLSEWRTSSVKTPIPGLNAVSGAGRGHTVSRTLPVRSPPHSEVQSGPAPSGEPGLITLVVLTRVNLNTRSSASSSSARPESPPRSRRRTRVTARVCARVIDRYSSGDVSALDTAEHLGLGKSTVLKILKESGVQVRKYGHRLT